MYTQHIQSMSSHTFTQVAEFKYVTFGEFQIRLLHTF